MTAADRPGKVGVFHPGVQHSWQTALALQQLGRLSFFATSIFYQPDRWPYRIERWLPQRAAALAHAEFQRFHGPALDPALVMTAGMAEWVERLVRRAGLRRLAQPIDRWGNRRFAGQLGRLVERMNPAVLWGFNGSAAPAFTHPMAAGRVKVLDRTTGHWRAYNEAMSAIHGRYRAWFLPEPFQISQRLIDADDAEFALADVILTGSPCAADTVRRFTPAAVADRVRVLPYCFDEQLFAGAAPPRRRDGPVRLLFVGQAHVRKGIHLVLDAFARLPIGSATLTILGELQVPPATFAAFADRVSHCPTVPRREVRAVMAAHDVLIAPSYFEGSSLSLLEGLAAGLALIQSREAGLGVTDDTGLLLPALTDDAVYEAMMATIDDRPRLAAFQAAAPIEAANYSFARYQSAIAALLNDME